VTLMVHFHSALPASSREEGEAVQEQQKVGGGAGVVAIPLLCRQLPLHHHRNAQRVSLLVSFCVAMWYAASLVSSSQTHALPSLDSCKGLFSSHPAGEIMFKNRVLMAPLTRGCRATAEGRVPNELLVEHYDQQAAAGLIISEATSISDQANGWTDTPGIYTLE
jgi:hypothetical protein